MVNRPVFLCCPTDAEVTSSSYSKLFVTIFLGRVCNKLPEELYPFQILIIIGSCNAKLSSLASPESTTPCGIWGPENRRWSAAVVDGLSNSEVTSESLQFSRLNEQQIPTDSGPSPDLVHTIFCRSFIVQALTMKLIHVAAFLSVAIAAVKAGLTQYISDLPSCGVSNHKRNDVIQLTRWTVAMHSRKRRGINMCDNRQQLHLHQQSSCCYDKHLRGSELYGDWKSK